VLTAEAAQVIDARGKIVVPGGIETHAHAVANVQPALACSWPGSNAGPLEHSLGAIWAERRRSRFRSGPHEGDLARGSMTT